MGRTLRRYISAWFRADLYASDLLRINRAMARLNLEATDVLEYQAEIAEKSISPARNPSAP
jgi:hypothetical protein